MTDKFENFVGTISRASKAINRIKGQEMGQFGLKGTDSMCLYYLGKNNGGATSAELSRQIGVDRAAVSRMVTRLENSGFVKTVLSPQGKNSRSPIVLTKKGEAAPERINWSVRSTTFLRTSARPCTPPSMASLPTWRSSRTSTGRGHRSRACRTVAGERKGPKCVPISGRKAGSLGNRESSDAFANLIPGLFFVHGCHWRVVHAQSSTHLGPFRSAKNHAHPHSG